MTTTYSLHLRFVFVGIGVIQRRYCVGCPRWAFSSKSNLIIRKAFDVLCFSWAGSARMIDRFSIVSLHQLQSHVLEGMGFSATGTDPSSPCYFNIPLFGDLMAVRSADFVLN